MLQYEPQPPEGPEQPWRFRLAVAASALTCVVGVAFWWQTAPALWELATFTQRGPIRPLGLVIMLFLTTVGALLVGSLCVWPAEKLSKRRTARKLAKVCAFSLFLPAMNFVLFFTIILVRRIELGD